jgi:two-component system, OmpR family, phosphate regulon sensor histidine kinase PhoR
LFSPRLYWRYYLGYALLLAIVTLGLAALSSRSVERGARTELARSLEVQATLLRELAAPVVAAGHRYPARRDSLYAELQTQLADMTGDRPARFTVILDDGEVIADSDRDPKLLENHSGRPELLQARAQGSGRSERFSKSLGTRLMYFAMRLGPDAKSPLGYARAAYPMSAMQQSLSQMRTLVLRSALIALASALLIGWLLTRRLTGPLRQIAVAVNAIRAGNYRQRVLTEDTGSIGELAHAFNAMQEQIEGQLQTIATEGNKIFAILEAMPDGVVAVDVDHRVMHLNRSAGQAFGVDSRGAEGQRLWEVVRSSEIRGLLERTLDSEQAQSLEATLRLSDFERVLDLRTTVLHDAERRVQGAVLVFQDVSRLRRLEGMRSDFVSNVSHELKTPLTALRGLIESVMDDGKMDGVTRSRFLDRMHVQTTRLNTLISDLLHISRLERSELSLDRHPIDLARAARLSLSQLEEVVAGKQVVVETDLGEGEIIVEADEESLQQIFDNLLTNAIRYTPAGGTIRVQVSRLEETGHAVLEVEDSGIGIESRYHDRIFERFYRVDKARSREAGGTGLGLSIVKHVVARLDGQLHLESSPGEGSCFRVTFNLSRRS